MKLSPDSYIIATEAETHLCAEKVVLSNMEKNILFSALYIEKNQRVLIFNNISFNSKNKSWF